MANIRSRRHRYLLIGLGLSIILEASSFVLAQGKRFEDVLGAGTKQGAAGAQAEFTTELARDGNDGVALRISAKLPPEHYVYSTTPGQGAETKITISRAEGLEAIDDAFTADHRPKVVDDTLLERTVEKYFDHVTWSRRYRLKPGYSPEDVSVAGVVKYQICDANSCRPNQKHEFDVKLSAASDSSSALSKRSAVEQAGSKTDSPSDGDASTRFEQWVGKKGSQTVGSVWSVSVAPRRAVPGGEVTVTVRARLEPGWHVYPLDLPHSEDGGSLPTVIALELPAELIALGSSFTGPAAIEHRLKDGELQRYHEGQIEWVRKFKVADHAAKGELPLSGKAAWQICFKDQFCLPAAGFEFGGTVPIGREEVSESASLLVTKKLRSPEASAAIDEFRLAGNDAATSTRQNDQPPRAAADPSRISALPPGESNRAIPQAGGINKSQGLPIFLLAAAIAGFAALLTPCVFPMIPITVSFFQKQSEKQHHRPLTMALVYCLGIMGTFTGLGMLMSIVFGASSLNRLSNNIAVNLFIAGILVFFSLNLLGMFEIRMPSWLLTYTAGKESRGGYVGVIFMALTFTLTSFTCTFAFAGLLLVEAMRGDRLWPVLGLLAFSAAFSLPFFFLAMFPSMLQKLPKSGGWMNVVKVIMGLVELGAAFKYFGTADQSWNGQAAIFDFHLMISAWAVISIAAALYLLGLFRLPHDAPSDHIGVVRFLSATSFLGLASYLAVGLFGAEKPQGAVWKYVEAFANADFEGGTDPSGPFLKHGDLKYALDFERALQFAIAENKPIFLDFTGVNCANCRFMEKGPMSSPDIERRLGQFVRIQLFTDAAVPIVPDREEAERLREFNERLQIDWLGDVTLPSYVVIPPDPAVLTDSSKILAKLGGRSGEAEFAKFLDDGWKNFQTLRNGHVVGRR